MDRKTAILALQGVKQFFVENGNEKIPEALDLAIEALEKLQLSGETSTNDLISRQAVANGMWIYREHCQVDEDAYDVATCSNCKTEITLEYPCDNYCPNCGAKMGGDTE